MSSVFLSNPATLVQANQTREITSVATTSVKTEYIRASEPDLTESKHVESYVRNTLKDEPILIEIARCESTFRQFDKTGHVLRGKVNSADVGVMQINEKYHAESAVKLGLNIYTLEGNVEYAKHIYDKYGAQPWSASSPCWGKTTLPVNELASR